MENKLDQMLYNQLLNDQAGSLRRQAHTFITTQILQLKLKNNRIRWCPNFLRPSWLKVFILFLLVTSAVATLIYFKTAYNLGLSFSIAGVSTGCVFLFIAGMIVLFDWIRDAYKNSHDTFDKIAQHGFADQVNNFYTDLRERLQKFKDTKVVGELPKDLDNGIEFAIAHRNSLSLSQIQALFEKLEAYYNDLSVSYQNQHEPSQLMSRARAYTSHVDVKHNEKKEPQTIEMTPSPSPKSDAPASASFELSSPIHSRASFNQEASTSAELPNQVPSND